MNKSELIDAIATEAGLSKTDAANALNALAKTVTKVLVEGNQIAVQGLGQFEVSNRAARTGRNPQTGQVIQIQAARVPKFKAGKALKDAVK